MSEPSRLSRIDTLWSVLRRAHHASNDEARAAQEALLARYGGAVRRYLRASLRDASAVDDAYQEFALRFVRGDFRSADPERGRFRNFVKTTLYHLVVDYRRSSAERLQPLSESSLAAGGETSAFDEVTFHSSWRQELLNQSWAALAEAERVQGIPVYTALRKLVDDPRRRSHEIAAQLSQQSSKPITAGNLRVIVHRARKLFADVLIGQVRESLETPTFETIEQELIDLELLAYCRSALTRLRESEFAVETLES